MRKMIKRGVSIALSLMLVMSCVACGSNATSGSSQGGSAETSATETSQETPQETSQETPTATGSGVLSVYTAYPEEHAQATFDEFERVTGIEVKYVRLSAGEIYTRVAAEANNPQASVWFGTSAETFMVAAEDGLLEKYDSPNIENIPEEYRDPDGMWVPFTAQTICFLTNADWLEENNLEAPTSWQDLLDPVYKDNIAISHPATSGMSYTWLAYMVQLMGEEECFEYLQKLSENIFQYAKSSNSPPRMVGMGECAVTIAYANQGMTNIQEGYPIVISYPEEGTSFEVSAMALIKDGPEEERENARIFYDWALSAEAQEFYASQAYSLPFNVNSAVPDGAVSLSDLKIITLDVEEASTNRERLLNRFETEIRGQENLS